MYERANFTSTTLTTLHGISELWRFTEKAATFGDSIKRRKKISEYFCLASTSQLRWIKSYYLRVTRERDDITSIPNIFVLLDIRWNFPPNEMSGRSPLIQFREELFSFFGEIQFRLRSQILSWNLPCIDERGRRLIKTLSKSAFFNESDVQFLFSSLDFI